MENNTLEKMLNELSMDDIKEQLALYQKLYYHKKKSEQNYYEVKKESARQYHKRKALDKILNDKNIDIMDKLELTETKTGVKVKKNQKYTLENVVMLKPSKKKTEKKTEKKTDTETTTENEDKNA